MYSLNLNGEYFSTDGLKSRHGFTTRQAGTNRDWSEQQEVFQRYFANQYAEFSFVTPLQIHGPRILVLKDALSTGHTVCPGYDGLLCPNASQRRVCLFVKSADCLTLIVESKKADLIGAIHLGWQGSLAGIIDVLGEKLHELGIEYSDLRVALGPSIGDCCYNIPVKRAQLFKTKYPNLDAINERNGQHYFSLTRFAVGQLLKIGFHRQNILFRLNCTSCQTDRYFSYRLKPEAKEHLLTFVTGYDQFT